MHFLLCLFPFILHQTALANSLIVTDVKVNVDANTPAIAREKAITEAHKIAFAKITEEIYMGEHISPPPDDVLSDMVTSFSIDKEKTILGNYTASLTFHFEEPQLKAWVEKKTATPSVLGKPFKAMASYTTFGEWQRIRKTIEKNGTTLRLLSLSTESAHFYVIPAEDTISLKERLEKEGDYSIIQGETWEISSSLAPRSS